MQISCNLQSQSFWNFVHTSLVQASSVEYAKNLHFAIEMGILNVSCYPKGLGPFGYITSRISQCILF